MRCNICGAEWPSFEALPRLVGYFAGFDGDDHPVLVVERNCACEATHAHTIDRAAVEEAAKGGDDKISASARRALEELECPP